MVCNKWSTIFFLLMVHLFSAKIQMINLCFLLDSSLVRSPFKLRINLEKSCIHLVGRVEMGLQLATESGCNLGSLLIDYLGLPLGAKHKSFAIWD